jgi:hypothetical protein
MATTRKCVKGKEIRIGRHVRTLKNGRRISVKGHCVPSKPGLKPGEPGIGPLVKHDLDKFGYIHVKITSASVRHAALAKAVKAYGALSVFRKLNAIAVYTRRTAPASSRIFLADRNHVRSKYMK